MHFWNEKEIDMTQLQLTSYRDILRNKNFLTFWSGFTLSSLGDSLTRVALTWYVFEETKSAQALGILAIAYTAPILIGGFIAGTLIDRFSARKVMIWDNLIRGFAFFIIPVLHMLDLLEVTHIYIFAAIYGSLMMISLAGGPTLIPSIVKEEQLETANAMETLIYTLSGVIGLPLAGFLVEWIGIANVVVIDAISYIVFALALARISVAEAGHHSAEKQTTSFSVMDAARLMVVNKVILSTTLMFMAANIGLGVMTVYLPLVSDQIAPDSSSMYGTLLGFMALGEVISSSLAGTLVTRTTLGLRIAFAQVLSGLSIAFLLAGSAFWAAGAGLFLLGFFSAPLTIWAQTLRMQVIPTELRGRTFALLRTIMQGATPIGGALGGFLFPLAGLPMMIAISLLVIGLPGLAGLQVRELREAG